jgi:dinuclear metal center YbgI/SA1388 family protein
MILSDIIKILEKFAPPVLQENYDNSGLLIGKASNEIHKALVSVDLTEEVLDEAISKSANLIISHHPIIFGGLKRLNSSNYVERIVEKAIKNDISIYAIHTNFDNTIKGTNSYIANKLGLKNLRVIKPAKNILKKLAVFCPLSHAEIVREAIFEAGAGNIGDYDSCSFNISGKGSFRAGANTNPHVGEIGKLHFEEEVKIESVFPGFLQGKIISKMIETHPYEEVAYDIYPLENIYDKIGSGVIGELEYELEEEEFLKKIKKLTDSKCIKHTNLRGKSIKKVALCGGSGAFLIKDAKALSADIYITGDVKYHEFFDAENKMIIADVGHYESEQFTKDLIISIIKENFSKFAVLNSEINTNPVKCL